MLGQQMHADIFDLWPQVAGCALNRYHRAGTTRILLAAVDGLFCLQCHADLESIKY